LNALITANRYQHGLETFVFDAPGMDEVAGFGSWILGLTRLDGHLGGGVCMGFSAMLEILFRAEYAFVKQALKFLGSADSLR